MWDYPQDLWARINEEKWEAYGRKLARTPGKSLIDRNEIYNKGLLW